ncbi:hypothetical protein [Parasphingorhabdus sp.]|uniref:hypothetical protein n=1 Tax=Parasphingorhabdus sp. TaxID=2709688 RepID=UPI0032EF8D2C
MRLKSAKQAENAPKTANISPEWRATGAIVRKRHSFRHIPPNRLVVAGVQVESSQHPLGQTNWRLVAFFAREREVRFRPKNTRLNPTCRKSAPHPIVLKNSDDIPFEIASGSEASAVLNC